MKLQPITTYAAGELYGYRFRCPGCEAFHVAKGLPAEVEDVRLKAEHVVPTTGPNAWGFNGSTDAPTFTPSILVHGKTRDDGTPYSPRCHSFVEGGRIRYLGDCTHPLAGQTVGLPEIEGAS